MAACRVEVVASTVEDVLAAAAGGADRVEFCTHLPSGGLTPGRALVEAGLVAARAAGIGFRVLVRPREGDFVYSISERNSIIREAEACLTLGVERVVTGALDADGGIDVKLLRALDSAVGLQHIVFHRAFDEADDYDQARRQLLDAGAQTVLTSGGKPRAIEGLSAIRASVEAGLEVVAGAGVQPGHAEDFVFAGVEAVHASCRRPVNLRGGRLFDADRTEVDTEKVRALVDAVRAVGRP